MTSRPPNEGHSLPAEDNIEDSGELSEQYSSSHPPSKRTVKHPNRPRGYAPRPSSSYSSTSASFYRSVSSSSSSARPAASLVSSKSRVGTPFPSHSAREPGTVVPLSPIPPGLYSTAQTGQSEISSLTWDFNNVNTRITTPETLGAPVGQNSTASIPSMSSTAPPFQHQSAHDQALPSRLALARNNYERAEVILSNFHNHPSFTFAEFLQVIFSPAALPHLSQSSRQILTTWLRGKTMRGTRPAEILDLWYGHDYSIQHDHRRLHQAAFTGLTAPRMGPVHIRQHPNQSYFLPPASNAPSRLQDEAHLYNAREGVEEWSARLTLHQIDYEAHKLTKLGGDLNQGTTQVDWDTLKEFSVNDERRTIQRSAPVLWATFQTVSFNRRTGDTSVPDSDSETGSEGSSEASGIENTETRGKKRRSPSIAVTIAILMLLSFRNAAANLFQTVIGIFLFACNAHKTVFRAFNRFGFSTAHSTVHRHLRRLGNSAQEALVELAEQAYLTAVDPSHLPQRYFLLIYDNINKYRVPRSASVARQSHLASGTAATAVVMENIPAGAFNPAPYLENIAQKKRQSLTLDRLIEDIQHDHLRRVGIGMILRVLIAHTPSLLRLSPGLEHMFQTPAPEGCAINRLPVRKSTVMTFGTSGINEATTKGNIDVTHDLVITQMKMKPEWFENMLILVGGDYMTTDRLNKAKRYRSKDVDAFERRQWVVPVTQLWHMKHAFLKTIFKVHWSVKTMDGIYGLHHCIEALGRKINASECPFYACHDALKVVFDTLILTLLLNRIRELYNDQLTDTTRTKINTNSHMLQELGAYFAEDGPLRAANLGVLVDIAGYIYDSFLTTHAYEAATSLPDDTNPSQTRVDDLMNLALSQISNIDSDMLETFGSQLEESSPSEGSSGSSSEDEKPYRARGSRMTTLAEPCTGDQALGTIILLLRDSFWYLEFATAVAEGDVGRVMEIIKVLRFAFWGGGARNYGNELLELACSQFYEYPPALNTALTNYYLVNPSGLPGHWHENDLLQEHHNRDTKTIFDTKQADFESGFMRKSVSVNIVGLADLRDRFLRRIGLNRTSHGQSKSKYEADINVLAQHYRGESSCLVYQPRRSHQFCALNIFGLGLQYLKTGGLSDFLARSTLNPSSDSNTNCQNDLAQTEEQQAQPVEAGGLAADWALEVDELTLGGHAGYLSLPEGGVLT